MDRQVFREGLHSALREILLQKVQQYLDQKFEAHHQVVRYISALDRKYEDAAALKEGFPGIYGAIVDKLEKGEEAMPDVYLNAVDQVASAFPEETVWIQDEDRFIIKDGDSILISIGKGGKRIARSVSQSWHKASQKVRNIFNGPGEDWKPWTQIVPLRRLIQFHLQDEKIVEEWVLILERIQLKIIIDIENLLVTHRRSDEKVELSGFSESLQGMLDQKKMALSHKLAETINQMETDIHWEAQQAGTVERSSNFYNEQRLTSRRKSFQKTLLKARDQRVEVQKLLLDRTEQVTQFFNLAEDVEQESDEFVADFQSVFENTLDQPLCNLTEILESAIEKVGQGHSLDNVLDLKNQLGGFVEERLTAPILILLDNQILSRKTEHFFEELLSRANREPQQAVLIFDAEFDNEPPRVEEKQMEWRLLVIRALREHLMNPLQPNQQKYEEFLANVLEDIREIENIVEVNLESALSAQGDQSDEAEDPAKIASEALTRILAKVEDLKVRSDEKRSDIQKVINLGAEKFTQTLLALLYEGDAKELQLLNAKYKVKETTKDWQTVLDSRLARTQDRLLFWTRFGWKKSQEYGSSLRKFAGFKDQLVTESKRADIATYLSETDKKMKELPYIYRQLFDFNALADERFFVSPVESSMTFTQAYEQWQELYPATFAIVGEKGSGKSSFLNLTVDSQLDGANVIQIELQDTIWTEKDLVKQLALGFKVSEAQNVQEIIEKINSSSTTKVVILEGLQNYFIRNINGYKAIEKLCYLISETKTNIFWSVSCSRYAWRFLDQTVQISEYFSHVVMSDTLDADQIKGVILNRHRSSGYTLVFEAGTDTLKSRSYRKLKDNQEEAQEYLQKNYFQKLTELAQGNASVAMIFWIRSICEFDETYFYIKPLEITSIEMIADLSPEVLFALAAFVLHDSLSDEDLSMVLNITVEESRLLLNRLRSRGLLEEKDGFLTINHLMYRQIVRVLKERNIIHLV